VIAGLPGEDSIAELYRTEGRHQPEPLLPLVEDFLEAGKKRLAGACACISLTFSLVASRAVSRQLKEMLVELMMEKLALRSNLRPIREWVRRSGRERRLRSQQRTRRPGTGCYRPANARYLFAS